MRVFGKYQILSINSGGRNREVSFPTIREDNIYTIVVGRNGTGKTSLLSKVVSAALFTAGNGDDAALELAPISLSRPNRVIALTNSRFDRFPQPEFVERAAEKQGIVPPTYYYLGLSGMRASVWSNLSKAVQLLMSGLSESAEVKWKLAKIFDHVGYSPYFVVDLRRPFNSKEYSDHIDIEREYERARSWRGSAGSDNDEGYTPEVIGALKFLMAMKTSRNNFVLQVDLLNSNWWGESPEFLEHVGVLLRVGILKAARLTLFDRETKDKVYFHQASSGQQCMLLMFLGIAGVISDGSLICIDEPEISLHPQWQAEFIGLLQEVFSSYLGCHFILATHSPQVVSGLTSENGAVLDLESGVITRSLDYSKRSADFQLSNIFKEPGFKNEYLGRILVRMLNKLAKGGVLSLEERVQLDGIEKIRNRFSEDDPVLHLFEQVAAIGVAK